MRVIVTLALLLAAATTSAAEPDHPWAGINPGHGALLRDPDDARAAARETVRLGLGITRIGIPVAGSEGGNSASWAPRGVEDAREWESRWHRLAWLQHKRYGYDSLILFSLRSPRGLWDIAGWADGAFVPNPPVYAAIREVYRRRGLENGGFEKPDDPSWMTVYGLEAARPREWSRVDFAAGNARSGARALRMEGPSRVRRTRRVAPAGVGRAGLAARRPRRARGARSLSRARPGNTTALHRPTRAALEPVGSPTGSPPC